MEEKEKNNVEKTILDAATDEFLNKGFSGARTVAIAEKAGVTHAMLHYYYRTKEKLFERVIDFVIEELINSVIESYKSQNSFLSFEDRVVAVMNAHLEFLISKPQLPAFLFSEVFPSTEHFEMVKKKASMILGALDVQVREALKDANDNNAIDSISLPMLISDVVSLNAATVISSELATRILNVTKDEYIAMRKEENEILIRKRLKKQQNL